MDKLNKIMDLILKSISDDPKWEDGDQQCFIFNDGVVILSLEDNNFKINIIADKPIYINHSMELVEDELGRLRESDGE